MSRHVLSVSTTKPQELSEPIADTPSRESPRLEPLSCEVLNDDDGVQTDKCISTVPVPSISHSPTSPGCTVQLTVVQREAPLEAVPDVAPQPPWAGFPTGIEWGRERLDNDLKNFVDLVDAPARPYSVVTSLNQNYVILRSDWSLVDFGHAGAPGWVRGIGPCILRFAYPRLAFLPTFLSTRKRPVGLWWYIVQKILPFPEQSQDKAPLLLVPAQLVTETLHEVAMWHMAGDEEVVEEMVHGVLIRDDLLAHLRQPVPHMHSDVPVDAEARMCIAWDGTPYADLFSKGLITELQQYIPEPDDGFDAVCVVETDQIPEYGIPPEPMQISPEEGGDTLATSEQESHRAGISVSHTAKDHPGSPASGCSVC